MLHLCPICFCHSTCAILPLGLVNSPFVRNEHDSSCFGTPHIITSHPNQAPTRNTKSFLRRGLTEDQDVATYTCPCPCIVFPIASDSDKESMTRETPEKEEAEVEKEKCTFLIILQTTCPHHPHHPHLPNKETQSA